MVSLHQRMARYSRAGRLAQQDVRRSRRLSMRAALELAAIIKAEEQREAMNGAQWPEGWAPFFEDDSEPLVIPLPEEGESDRESDDLPLLFSHFQENCDSGVRRYRRAFSSVKDYCLQPFANAKNEELFNKEENGGRHWDYDSELHKDHARGTAKSGGNLTWYGAATPQEAMDRAFKGWPEGAERVRSMMDNIDAPPPASLRRKVQRADQGDALDIHAVYRGGLDRAWERRRRLHSRARMSVRIVAQVGGSKHMQAEQMFWRGAAVAKLSELLEESSYRVEIVGADWMMNDASFLETNPQSAEVVESFIVKDAGAPMDLEQVAGVLCNAGFFRTFSFRSAYAAPTHEMRGTQYEYETEVVRRLGKLVRVPVISSKTGKQKVSSATLLARSYVQSGDLVGTLHLADDGTKVFLVPLSVGSEESAKKWVLECLAALEDGQQPQT